MSKFHTAILLFARSAKAEDQVKSLAPSTRANVGILRALQQTVIEKARMSKLPLIEWSERQQVGHTFGERLSHAVKSVFEKGFKQIIILGNDCPELKLADLQAAQNALENGKSVLGPNRDGGAYLIGLRKSDFNAATFKELAWQMTENFDRLKAYFEEQGVSLQFLSSRRDVNQLEALRNILWGRTLDVRLRKVLAQLLLPITDLIYSVIFPTARIRFSDTGLRAPPAVDL